MTHLGKLRKFISTLIPSLCIYWDLSGPGCSFEKSFLCEAMAACSDARGKSNLWNPPIFVRGKKRQRLSVKNLPTSFRFVALCDPHIKFVEIKQFATVAEP